MANRKWDDETIAGALAPVVAELGRMPTRTELIDRGLAAVWSAMRRNGGTRVWAVRATEWAGEGVTVTRRAEAPPLEASPAVPVEELIRVRAYFLAVEGAPGGPEAHWLRAEREVAASRGPAARGPGAGAPSGRQATSSSDTSQRRSAFAGSSA